MRKGLHIILAVHSRHGAYHPLKHHYILNLSHIRHINLLLTQIVNLLGVAPVAVNDAARVKMMEALNVVDGAHRFYHLVAASHRLHRVLRENQRIQPEIKAVGAVALHKKHRFAAAHKVDYQLVAQRLVRTDYLIVPRFRLDVASSHPHRDVVGARRRKLDVVGHVDKRAVGAVPLDGCPKALRDAAVQEKRRRVNKNHAALRSIQRRADIEEHGFLARRQLAGIESIVAKTVGKLDFTARPLHIVFRKHFLPQFHNGIDFRARQRDVGGCADTVHLVGEHIVHLIVEQHKQQHLKLCLGYGFHKLHRLQRLLIERCDRLRLYVAVFYRIQGFESGNCECTVAKVGNHPVDEACLARAVGSDHCDLLASVERHRLLPVYSFRKRYVHRIQIFVSVKLRTPFETSKSLSIKGMRRLAEMLLNIINPLA